MQGEEDYKSTPWKAIVSWILFFAFFIYSGAQVNSTLKKLDRIADTDHFFYFVLHFISYYLRIYIQLIIIMIIVLLFIYVTYMLSDAITTYKFDEKSFLSKVILSLIGGISDSNEKKGIIHFIKSLIDPANFFLTLREDIITCHYKPFFIGLIVAICIAVVIWFIYKRKVRKMESDDTYIEEEHDVSEKEKEAQKRKLLLSLFCNGLTFLLIIVICVYLYYLFQSIKSA